jgi:hypothetical protein
MTSLGFELLTLLYVLKYVQILIIYIVTCISRQRCRKHHPAEERDNNA